MKTQAEHVVIQLETLARRRQQQQQRRRRGDRAAATPAREGREEGSARSTRRGDWHQTLVEFVESAMELAGFGVELAGPGSGFAHLHAVCRHCAQGSPAIFERCGESLRGGLAVGVSRHCDRGHKVVGFEGGVVAVLPKTFGGAPRGTAAARSDRLSQFLDRLRAVAALMSPGTVAAPPAEPAAWAVSPARDPLLTSMVRSLVAAIDAKDRYTRGHSERVQFVSTLLGQQLGLDEATADALYWASLLHDVGKIGAPDVILNKPGRLSSREREIMQEHPARGAEILEPLAWLAGARLGVRHHHERVDGKGYPDQLPGDEIPLLARIIAVADTFDAIISRRRYRRERSAAVALDELRAVGGTQLDAGIVAAFDAAFDRICEALAAATIPAEGLGHGDGGWSGDEETLPRVA